MLPSGVTLLAERYPRFRTGPVVSGGAVWGERVDEALWFLRELGLGLDPWQELVLADSLAQRADGRWGSLEVGLVLPRQNGKNHILTARELAGLFLFDEDLILHTAHQFKSSYEAFLRVKTIIDNTDWLRKQVRIIRTGAGDQGVELVNGRRLRFIARSRVSGRGFSGDTVMFDEAFELADTEIASLFPTLSARPNPQLWYTSSAANQEDHPHCQVLGRVRRRGVVGAAKLAYLEWSVAGEDVSDVERARLRSDRAAWLQANPALDERIFDEFILAELEAMAAKSFDVERLGIGDWPSDGEVQWRVIPRASWQALADPRSEISGMLALGVHVSSSRDAAVVGVAGRRSDGRLHLELVEPGGEIPPGTPGTAWVVDRVVELQRKHRPCAIVIDNRGPAASLIRPLEDAGLTIEQPTFAQLAAQCGRIFDLCRPEQQGLRHLGQPELDKAVAGAATRPLGEAWGWSYDRDTQVDISPLVAVTLAAFGHAVKGQSAFFAAWR